MHYSRNHWQEDAKKTYRLVLCLFVVAVLMTSAAIASWGLYADRVSHSKLMPNCGWFTSVDDATAFTAAYPEYKKRLNPLNKPKACTSYPYPVYGK